MDIFRTTHSESAGAELQGGRLHVQRRVHELVFARTVSVHRDVALPHNGTSDRYRLSNYHKALAFVAHIDRLMPADSAGQASA